MPNPYINRVDIQRGNTTETLINIGDTTAVAADVAQGKYFYLATGEKVAGTSSGGGTGGVTQDQDGYLVLDDEAGSGGVTVESLSVTQNGTYTAPSGKAYSPVTVSVSGGSTTLKMGVLRPDATLVEKWTYDKLIVEDASVTLPSYSTSAKTLISGAGLKQVDVDFDSYDYMVLYRYIAVPVYSQGTNYGKGRFAYFFGSRCDEISDVPAGMLSDNGVYYTSRTGTVVPSNHFKYCYWSSASSFVATSNMDPTYGIYVTQNKPSISTLSSPAYITPYSPALIVKGSTTYLSQTYFEAITDIRLQYVVELWQAPRNNLNIDGFGVDSQLSHVISCLQSSTGTLT